MNKRTKNNEKRNSSSQSPPLTFATEEEYQNHKQCRSDIKKHKQEIQANFRVLGVTFIMWIAYLVVGSLIFFYIEQCYHVVPAPIGRPLEKAFLEICDKLNTTLKMITTADAQNNATNKMNVTNETNAYHEFRKICEQNIIPSYRCDLDVESFVRWIEYVVTIAFTIGYGYVVCHSSTGKIFTIIYTLPAICITIRFYACVGEIFTALTKIVFLKLELDLLKRTTVRHLERKTLLTLIFLSLTFWFLIVIANIPLTEEISFLDVVYMSFITMTTIGFGDYYYPFGKSLQLPHVFIFTISFYVIGVGTMASIFTEINQIGQKRKEDSQNLKYHNEDNNTYIENEYAEGISQEINMKPLRRLSPVGTDFNEKGITSTN